MQEESLSACRIDDEEVLAIHNAKLREITRALNDLFIIGTSTNLYSQSSTDMDYKDFEKLIGETHEIAQGDTQSVFNKIDSLLREQTSDEIIYVGIKKFKEDKKTKIIELLLSLDYTPPHDWREIIDHLVFLRFYYSADFEYYHPIIEAYFDISLCKLMAAIGSLSVISRLNGKDLERIKKMAKTKSDEAELKKTYVKLIYHGDKINKGMNLNTVATIIRDEFIKKQAEETIPKYLLHPKMTMGKNVPPRKKAIKKAFRPPQITMIKEYLFEDEKIRKDFKQKGRLWVIET